MTNSSLTLHRRRFLLGTAGASLISLGGLPAFALPVAPQAYGTGRRQAFDKGWRFSRSAGDGFETADTDDTAWRAVDLPHDWSLDNPVAAVTGPFDKEAISGTATAFTTGGEGWYRKVFTFEPPKSSRVEILFEGVYMNSDVWLNGRHLGNHVNGYTPFAYDLTPYLAPGGRNVLAVRVRNDGRNSRWYSGSGIYRHVWLDVLPHGTRLARWGTGVATRRIVDGGADLDITTRLEDLGNSGDGLTIRHRISDAHGHIAWQVETSAKSEISLTAHLAKANLWSPDRPALYTLTTELRRGKTVLDRQETSFGVRIIAFDPATGMTVNGVATKLRGGCIHHDNGLVGRRRFRRR